MPVQNFTTDSLRCALSPCSALWCSQPSDTIMYRLCRWLSNEQAAADSANFIDNVTFPGIAADLTAPGTPWIYYGVSPAPCSLPPPAPPIKINTIPHGSPPLLFQVPPTIELTARRRAPTAARAPRTCACSTPTSSSARSPRAAWCTRRPTPRTTSTPSASSRPRRAWRASRRRSTRLTRSSSGPRRTTRSRPSSASRT